MWSDHYAAVGTGSNIANVFLQQRPYWDGMNLNQCVYRVLEAKAAAEKNPYVGKETTLSFSTPRNDNWVYIQHLDEKVESIRENLLKHPDFELDMGQIETYDNATSAEP